MQDPAQSFRKGIENFGAAAAAESQSDGEIEFPLPADAEQVPELRVDWHDFESCGDVCFEKPAIVTCDFDHFNCVIHRLVTDGVIFERYEAVNAWD